MKRATAEMVNEAIAMVAAAEKSGELDHEMLTDALRALQAARIENVSRAARATPEKRAALREENERMQKIADRFLALAKRVDRTGK